MCTIYPKTIDKYCLLGVISDKCDWWAQKIRHLYCNLKSLVTRDAWEIPQQLDLKYSHLESSYGVPQSCGYIYIYITYEKKYV